MNTYIQTGEAIAELEDNWVIVFGGVTRPGNRRARRLTKRALRKGIAVVWFDGFEERFENSGDRVPLDEDGFDPDLLVVGFAEAETRTLAGRLLSGQGFNGNSLGRAVWKIFLRRLGAVLRPRAGWQTIRPDVEALARGKPPQMILYCDDNAITSAWHAARIWASTPVGTDLPQETR